MLNELHLYANGKYRVRWSNGQIQRFTASHVDHIESMYQKYELMEDDIKETKLIARSIDELDDDEIRMILDMAGHEYAIGKYDEKEQAYMRNLALDIIKEEIVKTRMGFLYLIKLGVWPYVKKPKWVIYNSELN